MKRLTALALVLGLLLGLCACGGAPVEQTEPEVPTEAPTQAPTEAPTEAEEQELVYYVTVIDEGESPVAGVTVRLNGDERLTSTTDEVGVATFSVPEGEYTAAIIAMPMGYDYATPEREFPFEMGQQRMIIVISAVEVDSLDSEMEEGETPEEGIEAEEDIPPA